MPRRTISSAWARRAWRRPRAFAASLGGQAARFGLRRGDGLALLGWLLDLVAEPDVARWLGQARSPGQGASRPGQAAPSGPPSPVPGERTV